MRRTRRGTMLMEAVLALPPLLWLILACFQFIYIAYAKLMTEYAAVVALRVAEVQPDDKAEDAALKAARRILCSVSYSSSCVDTSQAGALANKLPKQLDALGTVLTNIPDSVKTDLLDYPAAARQPLGWLPFMNASWIEDQVEVDLKRVTSADPTPGHVPFMSCKVKFKCPMHIPFVAETLSAIGVGKTFKPNILYGKKEFGTVHYLPLTAKTIRVLETHQAKFHPTMEKGGFCLGE